MDEYEGFISVGGEDYECKILKENSNFSIIISSKLLQLIPFDVVKKYLSSSTDFSSLSEKMKNFVVKANLYTKQQKKKLGKNLSSFFFQRIIQELDEIGWGNVMDLSIDCSKLVLKVLDNHEIVVLFDTSSYPNKKPEVKCELPVNFDFVWENNRNLKFIIEEYKKVIVQFSNFWNIMKDFDENTWVIEPDHPNRSHTFRRIRIGKSCSIFFEINPFSPFNLPEIRFLGSDSVVNKMKENFDKNINLWKPNHKDFSTVRKCIKEILQIKFPQRSNEPTEDQNEMCGICYSYRLDNIVPDKVCDNQKCLKVFHSKCLRKWLNSIPTKQMHTFNSSFLTGDCPYCGVKIKISTS